MADRAPEIRVLVVDDLPQNLFAMQQILKGEPYHVDQVSSANDALAALLRHEYACVLCDVQMPGMSGFEMAGILAEDPDLRHTPMVFVSAHHHTPATIAGALDGLGAYDFLVKPVDPVMVRGKIRMFTSLFAHRRELEARMRAEREALEALREANDALVRHNQDLEQFVHVVSHDLREPLRTVVSFSELVREEGPTIGPEETARYLDLVVRSARRMHALIVDLSAFLTLEAEQGPPGEVALADVLADVCDGFAATIRDLDAEVRVEGELPVVAVHRAHVGLLLQNLVGNALKFVEDDKRPVVRMSCSVDPDGWRVAVSDNGVGIDAVHHDEVFKMFRRLPSAVSRPGTGMGLALCRRIVERSGGSIRLTSEAGVGSRFEVFLPRPGAQQDAGPIA